MTYYRLSVLHLPPYFDPVPIVLVPIYRLHPLTPNVAPQRFQCGCLVRPGPVALDFDQQALPGLCLTPKRCAGSMASKDHSTLVCKISILATRPQNQHGSA